MTNLLNFPEDKLIMADLRKAIERLIDEGTPIQREEGFMMLKKLELRIKLVQTCREAAMEPRDFLIIPKDMSEW